MSKLNNTIRDYLSKPHIEHKNSSNDFTHTFRVGTLYKRVYERTGTEEIMGTFVKTIEEPPYGTIYIFNLGTIELSDNSKIVHYGSSSSSKKITITKSVSTTELIGNPSIFREVEPTEQVEEEIRKALNIYKISANETAKSISSAVGGRRASKSKKQTKQKKQKKQRKQRKTRKN